MEGRRECSLFCWFVLVSWCVGAVHGLGYCKMRKREGGGIEEKKKVVENRDGIFLLGFSLFLFQVSMFGLAMEGGREGGSADGAGSIVFLFLSFSFLGLATYLTLPYLAFEEETPNMYTVGQ